MKYGARKSADPHCVMGWLRSVGSIKLYDCFAKEPYKRDYILLDGIRWNMALINQQIHIVLLP